MLSAPSEKTVVEQTQDNIAAVQKQASTAVASLNKKILEVAGVKNNEELLTTVQTQAQAFATQVKGTFFNTAENGKKTSHLVLKLQESQIKLISNFLPRNHKLTDKLHQLQNNFLIPQQISSATTILPRLIN